MGNLKLMLVGWRVRVKIQPRQPPKTGKKVIVCVDESPRDRTVSESAGGNL